MELLFRFVSRVFCFFTESSRNSDGSTNSSHRAKYFVGASGITDRGSCRLGCDMARMGCTRIHQTVFACLFSESSGISILTCEQSTVWFAWRIATIKRILFTFRYRHCFHRTNLLRVYRATTTYGQQRLRLSGHSHSFARPLMVALRNGCMGCRCSTRSPPLG